MDLHGLVVGLALTGSFCTISDALAQADELTKEGINLIPIISDTVNETDTRFGSSEFFKTRLCEICGKEPISSIKEAEPIGPKKLLDALIIMPCTGNTMAKIANGITDTPVTMSAKSHMRNGRPVILAIASNDALAGNAKNLGALLNTKNIYFVPFSQDDPHTKANSLISEYSLVKETLQEALSGRQIQPLIFKEKA